MSDNGSEQTGQHKIHDICRYPEEIMAVRSARWWIRSLLVGIILSLLANAYSIVGGITREARLESRVEHIGGLQSEVRANLRELDAADSQIRVDSTAVSNQVLLELGGLREQVSGVDRRLDRLEQMPQKRR